MQQEKNQFVIRALIFREHSGYEDVLSSPTLGDVLEKFSDMIKKQSTYHSLGAEIFGFELHGNGKHLMDFHASHKGRKVEITWKDTEFHIVDHRLLNALSTTFPEQAGLLKSKALEESLGL
jgi:hypothetical protein